MNTPLERGLKPRTPDPRDFSHSRVFGIAPLSDLPNEYIVGEPLEFKNQDINYYSDFCASYAAAAVSEDQDGVLEVPEWTFAKAKQLIALSLGPNATEAQKLEVIQSFGLQLRDVCSAGVKYGFLERAHDPHACNTMQRPDRNFLSDWRNWPAELDMLGYEHAKNSFFSVDGPYDTFDNIRMALWQNRAESRSVITGAIWRPSWTRALGGTIYKDVYDPNEQGGGHAFKIIGYVETDVGLCLKAQMSDGNDFGEKGYCYFDRYVVNREFPNFGAFTFHNIPKEKAQVHNDFNYTIDAKFLEKLWKVLLYFFTTYKK